jgi:NADPH:quinone reductase
VIAALPRTMKAAVLDGPGPPEAFSIKDVPLPRLGHDHVLIALQYAGVGIWDAEQRKGAFGKVEPGTIPGTDGMGTIAAVGANVRSLRVGERVYSYAFGIQHGFYAEYVNVPASHVAPVPSHIDPPVAGGMPCVALTALSGIEALKPAPGSTLLVYGASGGVGSFGVWLASKKGISVIGSARPDAGEYVRGLGAAHAIDPHSSNVETVIKREAPHGFDAALITAGGGTLAQFLAHLTPGAKLAYPKGVEPVPRADGHQAIGYDGEATAEAFARLDAAIGSSTIALRVEEFLLQDVAKAHRRVEQGHVVGKIVLRIT